MRPFIRTSVIDGRDAIASGGAVCASRRRRVAASDHCIPTRPANEMPMMKCEARSIVNPFTRTFRKKVPAF